MRISAIYLFPAFAYIMQSISVFSPAVVGVESNVLEEAAYAARFLINASSWGVVSSLIYYNNKAPFGNVLSYSDGGKGTPYFYLTLLDDATANLSHVDSRSSLTVTQFALGTCGDLDPQEPLCAKVTLSGKLMKVTPKSEEAAFANATLFEDHKRFSRLPVLAGKNKFEIYKLDVEQVFVIKNYTEGPLRPSKGAYYNVKL